MKHWIERIADELNEMDVEKLQTQLEKHYVN